jgi:parallel beta-helix repeat protein
MYVATERRRGRDAHGSRLLAPLIVLALGGAPAWAGITWWVDNQSASCTDLGTGNETTPFCSIRAASMRAFPGDTVLVQPGLYREQVTPPISGTPDAPIIYRAAAAGAVILGTLDLSDVDGWVPAGTTTWARPFAPPSSPHQVFLDGARLAAAAGPIDMPPSSFFYDEIARVLYVDIGGPNPASGHAVEAGARTYGFEIPGLADLVIDGLEFRWQNHTAVFLSGASSVTIGNNSIRQTGVYGVLCEGCAGAVRLEGNNVRETGSVGIRLLDTTGAQVSGNVITGSGFHGIELQSSSGNTIARNASSASRRPAVRSAAGIDLNLGSNDNLIIANRAFGNDDSGIELRSGSSRNLVVRNASWGNGDHGFDANGAAGNAFLSNSSTGNAFDGFSLEGGSIGSRLADNIAVNNGLTTRGFELFVDPLSTDGSLFDFDIFWRSSGGAAFKVGGVFYATLSDFSAATGQEAHGTGADPRLADPANGDLRLLADSPAIDAADTTVAGFAQEDQDGRLPVDLFGVVDTGIGVPTYADRGAYEYDAPPLAALSVRPGPGPLTVTADASASTDPDSTPIVSYEFDFGDGITTGPQAGAIAAHTYAVYGIYVVTVRVEDADGLAATASAQVSVADPTEGEVSGLRFVDDQSLEWDPRPEAAAYNLYRGDLGSLIDTDGDGAAEDYGVCFASGLASAGASDASVPDVGHVYFYLVSGVFASGEGSLGRSSTGAPRPNLQPCP